MTSRKFIARASQELGIEVDKSSVRNAILRGRISTPERCGRWFRFEEHHLDQFVAYMRQHSTKLILMED
ncbi:MAG: hypothetical protein KDB00_19415 [Planctomycetales bacterium]|nr:hypothetical protein [Planctomycetales bacterium]